MICNADRHGPKFLLGQNWEEARSDEVESIVRNNAMTGYADVREHFRLLDRPISYDFKFVLSL